MISRSFLTGAILSLLLVQTAMAQISIAPKEGLDRNFHFETPPGQEISGTLKIRNLLDEETMVKIYPIDATQSSSGTLAFTTLDVDQNSIGKWTAVIQKELVIKNHGTAEATFKITVPPETPPGTYIGGLAVEEIDRSNTDDSQAKQVTVSARVVSKIYLKVPGKITHEYEWQNLEFQQNNGKELKLNIQNIGNSLLTVSGDVTVTNLLSDKRDVVKLSPASVFARKSEEITAEWQNQSEFGIYRATANLTFGRYDFLSRRSADKKMETKEILIIIVPQSLKIFLAITIIGALLYWVFRKFHSRKLRTNASTYKVGKDENINFIASKFNVSWKKIAALNKLKAPYKLKENDSLLIPSIKNEKDS